MILSASIMLDHTFNLKEEAEIIEKAVEDALVNNIVTEDINSENSFSTIEVGDWISNRAEELF